MDELGKVHMNDPCRADLTDPELQRRLAKVVALHCSRNSTFQDLHQGTAPSSATGDYVDDDGAQSFRRDSLATSVAGQ